MLEAHVAEVNRSLADERAMAGAQIRRFLILPKELDADDGELTRTMKVRRGLIGERYAPLVAALYDGATQATICDRSHVRGRPQGRDHRARRDPRHRPAGRHGEGRVKADVRKRRAGRRQHRTRGRR